jgi:hypothetical protein
MLRPLLTLALLALSLPAPALSSPLSDLPLSHRRWSVANDGDAGPYDADPSWWRQPADRADDDLPWPRPGWRQRNAYGVPGRPDDRDGDRYGYGYGGRPSPGTGVYRPGRPWPLAVLPPADQPLRRCGPGPALVGAAIGGGLGAALSDGSRQRQWALPIGATVGGLLGGVLAGC